jgi:Ca2+-binding EF-hand superfamily protein/ubiquitin-protein ligase
MTNPGAYKPILARFPNLSTGPVRRTVQENLHAKKKAVMLNAPFEDAGPFYTPSHMSKWFTHKQLNAVESLFRQCEVKLKDEHEHYLVRKAALDKKRQLKSHSSMPVDDASVTTNGGDDASTTSGLGSYKLPPANKKQQEGDAYDSNSDSDVSGSFDGNDEEGESVDVLEDNEDEYNDDVTYPPVLKPPEVPLLAIYDTTLKSPLPPCCMNETCKAFSKTHKAPAVVPAWVQKEWDEAEAAKLAALYGVVGEPAEESSEEEDEGEHIDFDSELDFGPNKVTVRYMASLLAAVGEDMPSKQMKKLTKTLDPESTGGIKYIDFIAWLYSLKLSRRKWGGRICITDDAPLPRCCNNPACKAHLQRPTAADDDEEEERQHHIMWSVFTRHDADGSGELGIDEVRQIFEEHSIPFDEEKLSVTFAKYDLDGSMCLEFEEFCSLMEDLDAASQIVAKRTDAYALPEHMREWFGKQKLEDLKTQFGIFDDSGDGNISAQELRAVLRSLGTELSHEQVVEIIDTIDADKSGEIEFPEFVSLMRKIERGEIDVGDSALTQAVMGSKVIIRFTNEVNDLIENPIKGISIKKLKKPIKPPTAEVYIDGPVGTPYEGYCQVILVSIPDDYPFSAPAIKFKHRILHINVSMMLDGSCSIPQIASLWDGGWDLRMLLGYVQALLKTPDTRLLPVALREQYKLNGLPADFDNDYGVEDAEMDAKQREKTTARDMRKMDAETEAAGFVNPYKLPKQPYSDVVQPLLSRPEDDLRFGGGKQSKQSFLHRATELYFERPAKFKAIAEDFARRECKPININGQVEDDAIIFA